MKSITAGLIFAFAVAVAGMSFAVEKDVVPTWGTPEWAAYAKADKDSKAAKDGTVEGYVKAAQLTPFKWAAAWHLFNAAKLTWEKDGAKASEYLDEAEALMSSASLNVPTAGPNTPENLSKAVASIRKAIEDKSAGK